MTLCVSGSCISKIFLTDEQVLKPRFTVTMGEGKVFSLSFKSTNYYSRTVAINLLCRISDCGWLGWNILTKEGGSMIVVIQVPDVQLALQVEAVGASVCVGVGFTKS